MDEKQKCCCPNPDAIECFVMRYNQMRYDDTDIRAEARSCGGCECGCHNEYDEDPQADYEQYMAERKK